MSSEPTGHARVVLPSAQPIYAAARRWRDESLIEDRSLFDGRNLYGRATAQGLITHFVDNLEEGDGTFVSKLRYQLREASADTVQVAAELLYVHCLITATEAMKGKSKATLVETVVGFRTSGTSGLSDDLREALNAGVARPGQAYNNYRWKMFRYLVRVFEAVKGLAPEHRAAALATPASFAELVAEIDEQSVWSQRYAIEHLLFPDDCPTVLSRDDRALIVEQLGRPGESVADVVRRLDTNVSYGERSGVNLYRTPYREQWQGPSPELATYAAWSGRVLGSVDLAGRERDYKMERVPLIQTAFAAADSDTDPSGALRTALVGLNLVDYRVVDDFLNWSAEHPDTCSLALRELAREPGPASMDRFLALIPREQQLSGRGARISLASTLLMGLDPGGLPPWRDTQYQQTVRLTGGYHPQEAATAGEVYVLFLERLDVILAATLAAGTEVADRLDAQGLAWTIATWLPDTDWSDVERDEFLAWRDGKPLANRAPSAGPAVATNKTEGSGDVVEDESKGLASVEALAESLLFAPDDVPWLQETIDLLTLKRQLILQGPPGTGKTYVGQALAKFVAGSASRVETVQFHPSYAYEDFVAGLRPDPENPTTFTVVKGPFVTLCERARAEDDKTFVLVVDEINRGNIPAVFGELYFLLEYRNTAIAMGYGGARFSMPENVLILGTMNTADRSITSLDAALRRRFFVRDLRPGEPPLHGVLGRFLDEHAPDLAWLSELLDLANSRIDDPDQAIGPSHFLSPGISELGARRAWDNSVVPMARELFYSQPARVAELDFDVLKTAVVGSDDDPTD